MKRNWAFILALGVILSGGPSAVTEAQPSAATRPQGPCDIYAAAGAPCVAAHSSTRALYASYNGPLYQVMRQSDGKQLDIAVVKASARDPGGYADAAAQDRFCANSYCWITKLYDQSPKHNDLFQAPRGAFSGPAMGGANNIPLADAAPVTVMGHKVYGVFITPGMGLRQNDPKGTAVDDQAEGQYWVIDGQHYNSGCCFDYGNAEIDSKDDGNGTMETTYFGNSTGWYHGNPPGPWVMTDQENNLVGCVNKGSTSKLCTGLPNITWRFVTAMAKGKPHEWASLGGDAQKGPLQLMFEGPRVDVTYDPMRKQGAILLGNGGDNSIASQGTFYEGAMTAANTYPAHDTDQQVQANVVAAGYDVQRLGVASAAAGDKPTGLQTFTPGSSQDTVVTFVNTTGGPVTNLRLGLSLPPGWRLSQAQQDFAGPIQPGAKVQASFHVTAPAAGFNGDMVASAAYVTKGTSQTDRAVQKLRNVRPVKINEFRIGAGSAHPTDAFIELYNAGAAPVDISNWSLAQHQTQQAIFSDIRIPAGTRLQPRSFYLLGLANSGLAAQAQAGDTAIHVRSIEGMKQGDVIRIGNEVRHIARLGSAAGADTTIWQPADRPMLSVPAGATSLPVASTDDFKIGEKVGLGHGAAYPTVSRTVEKYELATITAVGKPGTQAFLGADAPAGASNISVTSVANISVGDKIMLDIDSVGHGIETVTVKNVGTPAIWLALVGDAQAGATRLRLRRGTGVFNGAAANSGSGVAGLKMGQRLIIGMPGNIETVSITAIDGDSVTVTGLTKSHMASEPAVEPGTGLDLAAPLKFAHAGNLPFSAAGTGIRFTPATRFAHSANEPVQPLGSGIVLDQPLVANHAINSPVRAEGVTGAGYQGPAPQQWFGGPALSNSGGAMVLKDAKGLVVDSLNYGLIVDPWAAEGYHYVSGTGEAGCRAPAPGVYRNGRLVALLTNSSAGRFPDGADQDSNCNDFAAQPASILQDTAPAGATNLKVAGVAGFAAGQKLILDDGANREMVTIASVGAAGATKTSAETVRGATVIPVAAVMGFTNGQTITIDTGANQETATIAGIGAFGARGPTVTVTGALRFVHPAGTQVSGSGIILAERLAKSHPDGAQVSTDLPTPGAPNRRPGATP